MSSELEERGFDRPHGLDCLCSGSRAVTLWGGSIIGSLKLGLNAPDFLGLVCDFSKPGDRIFLTSYEDKKCWSDEQRSECAEVLILKVHQGRYDEYRRWCPPIQEYRVLSYIDLRGEAPALMVEEVSDAA